MRPPLRRGDRRASRSRADPPAAPVLPSREQVRHFVRTAAGRVGKREIAREFRLGPEHRPALRALLKDLAADGTIAPAGARRFSRPGRLPEVMLVQVTGTDPDGDAIARPVGWEGEGRPPLVLMHPEPRGRPALAPGERVLARLRPVGPDRYEGRTLKRLAAAPGRVLGVFRPAPGGDGGGGGRVVPTDRRAKAEWRIPPGETGEAEPGEIVLAEPLPHRGAGLKPARIVERLGNMGDARSVSLICIATHDIPQDFPPEALAEAGRARGVALGRRTDLSDIPLVTIDGEDARDFDDAVFAEPDGDGHRLIVAIADVAHYVRADSALDRAARTRGNSVYFPDRVVPMLPEALSNGWCSLRPDEERGCLYVEMRIDAAGRKTAHRFGRGLMRSAARLTYAQVQAAADSGDAVGLPDGGLPAGVLTHLYAAFRALLAAREARGTLDLDLPERRVVLDEAGRVLAVSPRPRLDSHRLIEEFMVLANVCAAEELERRHQPCMYRVHAPPSAEKLEGLRAFLHGFDISLPPGDQLHPRDLDRVLRRVAGSDEALLVNEVVLRSQSQAAYSPDNIGHFGLALSHYAHFTSPIRRYADLLVHRALIAGLRLGPGGLDAEEAARFPDIGEHITGTERRAQLAERDAIDRYLAAYMADKVGAVFYARISGVTRFGIFVTVTGSGASGLVPISTLPDDFWMHDEAARTLSGRRTRIVFRLAQEVEVRLAEASPVTGGLVFHVLQGPADRAGVRRTGGRSGRR
ncbi:MAG TPA: ribonuclease R [Acetobacteraceae bacterium]|nr:ribonuclease R [Acetobacteraceae bacterium]